MKRVDAIAADVAGQGALAVVATPEPSFAHQALAIPNILTYLRLLAIPLFVQAMWEQRGDAAFWLFAVAAFTDGLDGFVARVLNQRTRLGAMLDPLADKLLTFAALVMLVSHARLPLWLLLLVVLKDASTMGAIAVLRATGRQFPATPSRLGKYSTFALVMTLSLALWREAGGQASHDAYIGAFTLLSAQCVAITFVQYFVRWTRLMRAPR